MLKIGGNMNTFLKKDKGAVAAVLAHFEFSFRVFTLQ